MPKQDTEVVRVIFRKWRSNQGVIALFPDIAADNRGSILSYEHIGQHGGASVCLTSAYTLPAQPHEYAPLMRELQSIGYKLRVVKRR